MKRNSVIAVTLWGGLLFSIGTTPATADDPARGDATRGARTWADNCDRCHNMRDPRDFRDDEWRSIMAHMRVRGGLTGQEARDVVAFLQASNYRQATAAPVAAAATTGGEEVSPGRGEAVYNQTCVACHGADGKGALPGVPDFTDPSGRLGKSDEVLLKHIVEGFQSPGSPMAMPPKGGNPDLTVPELRSALAYIRERFGK